MSRWWFNDGCSWCEREADRTIPSGWPLTTITLPTLTLSQSILRFSQTKFTDKNKIQFLFQTRLGRPLARKLRWGSHVIIQFRLIHSRFVPYFRFSSSLRRLSRKNAPFLLAIAKIGGTPMPKLILTLFLELKKCSNWLGGPKLIVKRFQKWKVAQNRLRGRGGNMCNTKGTTDPRVEFSFTKVTGLVQTKFMIKFHVQNHDQSSTSKSQPNISISTKLQL